MKLRLIKEFYKNCCFYEKEHKYGSVFRSVARISIRTIVFIILFPIVIGDFISRKIFRLHDIYARPFEILDELASHDASKVHDRQIKYIENQNGQTFVIRGQR